MKIRWHGGNSVSLRGKGYRVVLGLFDSDDHKPLKLTKEDLLILPYKLGSYAGNVQDMVEKSQAFVIDGAGEYSYNGATVQVVAVKRSDDIRCNLISLSVEGVLVVYVAELDRDLQGKETDFIGNPDLVFIPVGGTEVLDHKQAAKMANVIEPRVLLPINYQVEDTLPEKSGVDLFLKEYGSSAEAEQEFVVKKSDLPVETTDLRLLHIDLS